MFDDLFHILIIIKEIGNEGSFSQILLEDTKIVKKYLRLLYNGQEIDLKRLQEWITDRRIKVSFNNKINYLLLFVNIGKYNFKKIRRKRKSTMFSSKL